MSRSSIKWEGLTELELDLAKMQRADGIKRAVRTSAAEFTGYAQRNAPVDTGNLRRSIVMESPQDGGFTVEVTARADYSGYVEYGTRFMKAQPFMEPAHDKEKPRFMNRLTKAVKGR